MFSGHAKCPEHLVFRLARVPQRSRQDERRTRPLPTGIARRVGIFPLAVVLALAQGRGPRAALYGGDSATGSGRRRAGNCRCVQSCTPNAKWITSFAAIVASPRGDGGQGRVRCSSTDASRYFGCFFFAFLPVFRSIPLPQYPDFLCSLIAARSFSVQHFERRPLTMPGTGVGICFLRTHRLRVLGSTSSKRLASEIEYISNMPQVGYLSSKKRTRTGSFKWPIRVVRESISECALRKGGGGSATATRTLYLEFGTQFHFEWRSLRQRLSTAVVRHCSIHIHCREAACHSLGPTVILWV
jgi:hypothetical protein